ncbi:MAG TPA: alpha/beta hydrolase family protein [Daejeonella sp.]|nr:alpha/beta hydrolase family protein [Daejeonella sp.]
MTKNITILFLLVFWGFTEIAEAASVDTIRTYSAAMKKEIKVVVIKPDGQDAKSIFPVVYLLHGHGGNYSSWIKQVPKLKAYADLYQILIVCPDGGISSWYFDSLEDPASRYETYVANELVNAIDKQYSTVKGAKGRAITGLSMGGHGALYLAFKHSNIFGAAGSMSGGLDLRPFPNNWSIASHLGKYADNPSRWDNNSVINLTHLLTPESLKLLIDCGTQDFFYGVNTAFHQKLIERNIPHDFISRPGVHNWDYWRNAIEYQLVFMSNFFNGNQSVK